MLDIGIRPYNANFVNSSNPWFNRGGNASNSTNAGAFNSNNNNGNANNSNSWRGVLVARLQYKSNPFRDNV